MNAFELTLLDRIQEVFRCAFLDVFFPIVTKFGDHGIFWIAVALLFLIFRKTRRTGAMMLVAMSLGLLTCNLGLKPLVARIRPYDLNPAVDLLVAPLTDYSFPSGHTLASAECATVLMIRDRRFGIPALILAVLVAVSRLYLYVHYPTDVLAGALIGTLFGILGVLIVRAVANKTDKKNQFPD